MSMLTRAVAIKFLAEFRNGLMCNLIVHAPPKYTSAAYLSYSYGNFTRIDYYCTWEWFVIRYSCAINCQGPTKICASACGRPTPSPTALKSWFIAAFCSSETTLAFPLHLSLTSYFHLLFPSKDTVEQCLNGEGAGWFTHKSWSNEKKNGSVNGKKWAA